MIEAAASPPTPVAASAPPEPGAAPEPSTFGAVLSALNPLQYLPVVGTIYRAVTGDEVAEPVRRIGSAIGSFLLGGPIGVAVNLGTLVAEKVTGIDLDRVGQSMLSALLGTAHADEAPVAIAGDPANAAAETTPMTEADVLNARELQRLHAAHAVYAAAGAGAAAESGHAIDGAGSAQSRLSLVGQHVRSPATTSPQGMPPEMAKTPRAAVAAPSAEAAGARAATAARAQDAYRKAATLAAFAPQGLG